MSGSHALTEDRAWETTVATYRSKLSLNYSDFIITSEHFQNVSDRIVCAHVA